MTKTMNGGVISDLISRSALLDDMKNELEKALNEGLEEDECEEILTSALTLKIFVNRQPTVEAIPKEKLDEICEKLEGEKDPIKLLKPSWMCREERILRHKGYCEGLDYAIEIVKGVMNERN